MSPMAEAELNAIQQNPANTAMVLDPANVEDVVVVNPNVL